MLPIVLQAVPVVILLLGGVWWMSELSSRVKALEQRIANQEVNLHDLIEKFEGIAKVLNRLEAKIEILLEDRNRK